MDLWLNTDISLNWHEAKETNGLCGYFNFIQFHLTGDFLPTTSSQGCFQTAWVSNHFV